ncbi:MAG TPA: protocatechuate 3,4-dioxygenase subunit alpha [Rubrobacter sp.]|nr:protocatechuate 3,4-dioxygenase subunit alpha [Rubrobacter sp.]
MSGEPGPTPSQTIGPFFHDALLDTDLTELVSPDHPEAIRIAGAVYDGAGEPVPDAMVEIWQADAAGRYGSEEFSGFGRSGTDEHGRFSFTTLKPGPAQGPDGTLQAPHANVTVFARGLLRQVVTRVYFPDEEANAEDPLLASIEDRALRDTLFARDEGDRSYRFEVRLQGEGQTAFFDV